MKVITTHIGADFDSLASMVAARKLHPDARLVFSGAQEQPVRRFLRSPLFTLAGQQKLKGLDLRAIRHLILVDTRQAERIGPFAAVAGLPAGERPLLEIYDHHPPSPGDLAGDRQEVAPTGATITLLVEILRRQGLAINPQEATLFLLGIHQDTGHLTFPSTTERDLLAAAHLLACGADLTVLARYLAPDFSTEQLQLLDDLIRSAERWEINGLPVVVSAVYKDRYIGELALLVHRCVDLERLTVFFALVFMEDRLFLVARSLSEAVDAGRVAEHFGGGGHPTAASAALRGVTLVETKEKLLGLLRRMIRPPVTAGQIMNPLLHRVSSRALVQAAQEAMNRWRVNALPVGTGRRVIGTATRQVVSSAIAHGLGGRPLREVMSAAPPLLPPEAGLERVQEEIVGRGRRIVLVGPDPEHVQGIITRMDLFRQIYQERGGEAGQPPAAGERGESPTREEIHGLLARRLPGPLRALLERLGGIGAELGVEVYLVGGVVRDLLLGRPTADLDLVVEGDGIRFARRAAERLRAGLRVHRAFGTATLKLEDGQRLDVATARTEYYPAPGALPQVERGLLRQDLYRRDFTINTLALDLSREGFGRLLDFFGGLRDLRQGVIRVLHGLSFIKDPTRILRAVRFSGRLDFTIGPVTRQLIETAARNRILDHLSGGRLLGEVVRLLEEEHVLRCLESLSELRLLKAVVHPQLRLDAAARDLLHRVEGVLQWHRLLYRPQHPRRWLILLMALGYPLDRAAREALCRRYGLAGEESRLLLDYKGLVAEVLRRLEPLAAPAAPRWSAVYRLLEPQPLEVLLFALAACRPEPERRALSHFLSDLAGARPAVSGRDLRALGLPPGPRYGQLLREVLLRKLDGRLEGREEELDFLRRRLAGARERRLEE